MGVARTGSVRDLPGTELFSILTHGCQCPGCDTVVQSWKMSLWGKLGKGPMHRSAVFLTGSCESLRIAK